RTLQDQRCRWPPGREISSWAGSYRTPKDNDPVRLRSQIHGKVVISRSLVFIGGLLARLALAGAITLIVIGKDAESNLAQVQQPIPIVAQIFRVSVAHQQSELGRRIREINSRNLLSTCRADLQDLRRILVRRGVRLEEHAIRKKDRQKQ